MPPWELTKDVRHAHALASIRVLLLHVWLSANAFLVGVQLDACVRERT